MAAPTVPAQAVQQAILQSLYALFLGGIITAFLVVGLLTFFPEPSDAARIDELQDRQNEINDCYYVASDCTLTPAQQQELKQIEDELDELYSNQDTQTKAHNRVFGVVLIVFATGLLALSLVRWDRAIVLSNGLLLGGLFTMVGGIGVTISTGDGVARFLILSLALAVTVGLGYLRFARRADDAPTLAPAVAAGAPDTELGQRVAALEGTLAELRRALGG